MWGLESVLRSFVAASFSGRQCQTPRDAKYRAFHYVSLPLLENERFSFPARPACWPRFLYHVLSSSARKGTPNAVKGTFHKKISERGRKRCPHCERKRQYIMDAKPSVRHNGGMTNQPNIKAESVFEILMRENSDMLTTYLRAVVWQPAVVDDLFQETMLVAWRKLDEYDRSRPFGAWLRGIAARLAMAHYRKARRDFMVCDEAVLEYLGEQVQHISGGRGDTWDEKIAALHDCIESLPDALRQAIDLRYLQNEPARNIADHLGISAEAIKKRLQRAREQLGACLKRKNVLPEMNP